MTMRERESGATGSQIGTALREVETTFVIHLSNRRCYGCGEFVDAVSLDRPDDLTDPGTT